MLAVLFFCLGAFYGLDQNIDAEDEYMIWPKNADAVVSVTNLNQYFIIRDDSSFTYPLQLNRQAGKLSWHLKNNPPAVQIDHETGTLRFSPDRMLFKTGILQYNTAYIVELKVHSFADTLVLCDTSFTVIFYNNAITNNQIIPSVSETIYAEEGDSVKFTLQCSSSAFRTTKISFTCNLPIHNFRPVHTCNDDFFWLVPYNVITEEDSVDEKEVLLKFFEAGAMQPTDTALVRIMIRPGIDYPLQYSQHKKIAAEVSRYIKSLKLTFYVSNKNVRANKLTRTLFDVAGSVTALTSSVIPAHSDEGNDLQKILPGIGLTLIPVKETLVPAKTQEKTNANMVRAVAKKLEYCLNENKLTADKDPEIGSKIKTLQEELKQCRLQLMELPLIEYDENLSIEDAEKYFREYKSKKRQKLVME